MKTSLATEKVKEINTYYKIRIGFLCFVFLVLFGAFGFFYLTSLLGNFSWGTSFRKIFFFLFSEKQGLQITLAVIFLLLLLALEAAVYFITSFIFNGRYQKEYLDALFQELKLNEIYFQEKRGSNIDSRLPVLLSEKEKETLRHDYRFSLKSILKIDLYQLFFEPLSNHYKGILLFSESETEYPFYFQISTKEMMAKDEIDGRNIYQYPVKGNKNSSRYLYINSSYGRKTQQLLSENVLKTAEEFAFFTRSDYTFTVYKNSIFLRIDGWELHLSDSLWHPLSYDRVDQKVEALTQLIDYFTDITIYLSRNYREVMKNGE